MCGGRLCERPDGGGARRTGHDGGASARSGTPCGCRTSPRAYGRSSRWTSARYGTPRRPPAWDAERAPEGGCGRRGEDHLVEYDERLQYVLCALLPRCGLPRGRGTLDRGGQEAPARDRKGGLPHHDFLGRGAADAPRYSRTRFLCARAWAHPRVRHERDADRLADGKGAQGSGRVRYGHFARLAR